MLTLKIHNLDDVAVLRCVGRITADDGDALRTAVLTQPDVRIVVLDLAGVSAVDAAGLGMLVSLRNWASATGKQLKLMNVVPRVEEVLELTHLKAEFEICSVADMLELLCRASRLPSSPDNSTTTGSMETASPEMGARGVSTHGLALPFFS